ncbi:hypothetical protein NHX12_010856 [Muraenolepis orangiensis]|uniref:Uncharacterized protein n=1 Tax=Muraenolepis orangiensis TaxID=630683 RepID=A0A9Q0DF07_9TELE|nr:hypothetical protein NHX12_010856 [Muraenolepis orangiensis]
MLAASGWRPSGQWRNAIGPLPDWHVAPATETNGKRKQFAVCLPPAAVEDDVSMFCWQPPGTLHRELDFATYPPTNYGGLVPRQALEQLWWRLALEPHTGISLNAEPTEQEHRQTALDREFWEI